MKKMNEKDLSGQMLDNEAMEKVSGGDNRRMDYPGVICPICGKRITGMTLEAHMKGHPLEPCPVCGRMMPAGPNAKCFHCGYTKGDSLSE